MPKKKGQIDFLGIFKRIYVTLSKCLQGSDDDRENKMIIFADFFGHNLY